MMATIAISGELRHLKCRKSHSENVEVSDNVVEVSENVELSDNVEVSVNVDMCICSGERTITRVESLFIGTHLSELLQVDVVTDRVLGQCRARK